MKTVIAIAMALGVIAAAQDPVGELIAQGDQPAVVEPPAFQEEEEATLVESLVVRAVRPGPAFWKVADADSVVWVIGIPDSLPRSIEWNRSELRAHLRGGNVLINGASGVTVNPLLDPFRIMFNLRRFRAERPLDQVLSPDMMRRFDAAVRAARADRDTLLRLRPSYAAFFLSGYFERRLDMRSNQPADTIAREARRVRTERVGRSRVIDLLRIIESMPDDKAAVCMEDAIRQVEAGPERALEAARGWARGDLTVAVSAERGFDRCLSGYPEIAAETRRQSEAVAAAVLDALKRPGKSVAVADLRPLLASDGILVRLMAQPGVTVTAPDVPGLEGEIGYQPEDYEASTDPEA